MKKKDILLKIKKTAAIALAAALILSTAACGSQSSEQASSDTQKQAESASSEGGSTAADTSDEDLKVVNIGFTGTGDAWNGGAVGMAQLNGYYEEELAKVGYKPNMLGFAGLGPAMNEAVASNSLDYVVYAEIPWVTAVSNGIDLDIISICQVSAAGTITVPEGSDIKSLEDLKGKKVGYTRGTVYHTFLIRVLESVGLTIDDVELVNLSADNMVSALVSGDIDAASLTASNALRLQTEYNATILTAGWDNMEEWASLYVLAVRPDYKEENPEVNKALIRATIRGREAAAADPETFYNISSEKGNLTVESLKTLYPAGDDGQFTGAYPIGFTDSAINILKGTNRLMYESELTPVEVNVDDYIDTSYYDAVIAEQ